MPVIHFAVRLLEVFQQIAGVEHNTNFFFLNVLFNDDESV